MLIRHRRVTVPGRWGRDTGSGDPSMSMGNGRG